MSAERKRQPAQLPLDLTRPALFDRDDLVVTAANLEAVTLVDRWPDWPAPVVVLAGPPGSGKTHLADIWRQRTGADALDRARLGMASPGPLLIDDADGPGLDETGLFHIINAVKASGGSLLLTARRFPAGWGVALPDLASRLKAAATVEIREPDDLLLSGVLTKLFADRQVEVEPHVVQFLVRRIERSLAAANLVVTRLDRMALERQCRISRALAAEAVALLEGRPDP